MDKSLTFHSPCLDFLLPRIDFHFYHIAACNLVHLDISNSSSTNLPTEIAKHPLENSTILFFLVIVPRYLFDASQITGLKALGVQTFCRWYRRQYCFCCLILYVILKFHLQEEIKFTLGMCETRVAIVS